MLNLMRIPYRALRKLLRDMALRILSFTDDSFLINYSSSGRRQENGALNHSDNKSIMTEVNKANPLLVLNDNGAIANVDSLRFIFLSIFENKFSSEVMEALWSHISAERPPSQEKLVESLHRFLVAKFSNTGSQENAKWAQAFQQLCIHAETTKENGLAYSTESGSAAATIIWPDPTDKKNPRSLFQELPFAKAMPLIDRDTPIGSAGSCFAMEIAHRLQADGFNYVVTEPYIHTERGFSNSCARWGTIFNTPSFRQLVEFALLNKQRPKLLWSLHRDGVRHVYDPFREDIEFGSEEEFLASYEAHRAAAKEALLRAKVFVLTLGMNEVWSFKNGGEVCSRAPWRIASYLVRKKVLTVEENLKELQTMLDLWRSFNPDLKLIVSVSPVPLHATFRSKDHHVIAANCHSKSTLRVVAEEFVARNKGVYYFPSYEAVMYCTESAWTADQRHVSAEAVANVMRLFNKTFVTGSNMNNMAMKSVNVTAKIEA